MHDFSQLVKLLHPFANFKQLSLTSTTQQHVNVGLLYSFGSNSIANRRIDEMWLHFTSSNAIYGIPEFIATDAKLACNSVKYSELLPVGRNLFGEHHRKFVPDIAPSMPGRISRGTDIGAQQRF
ncbi:hypothetical protein SAMN05216325_101163 [Nitrosomonas marina]|uniref:Uncharacterized protein n=2 Tax=Nitrosomonas marina TaxID=917 RepID=A0A1H8AKM6_9PROT|nr:hypothetical protein SAMN05216325_101163 [Nitrosomonas marina]